MADDIAVKMQKLPEVIQDFLLDPNGIDILENIFDEEKVSEKDRDVIADIVSQVLLKELPLANFIDELRKKVPDLPQETIKRTALKIAGNRFLPVESYLGSGVEDLIKSLGGKPEDFNIKRVEVKNVSPKEAAVEIFLESGIKVEDPYIVKRIQEIIEMRLKEVRDDLETAAALVRGQKIGGANLSEDDAKKIIDCIKAKLLKAQIAKEEEVAPTGSVSPISPIGSISPISPMSPIGSISPISTADVYSAEEEREVSQIKKEMKEKIGKISALSIEESISRILKESGFETKDPLFVSKLRSIAFARLSDIRDAIETKEILMRHSKLGGLGLSLEDAEKLGNIIEKEFKLLNQTIAKETVSKIEEARKQEEIKKIEKEKALKEKEEKELNERWMRLTRKTAASKKEPVKIFKPIEPPKEVEDVRPQSIVSAPSSEASASQISVPSEVVPPKEKPPKLIGPVEELAKITLDDFRKLSPNPQEAANKINSKIDLLGAEDFSKKIAGINAWKQSEVLKVYFEILKESIISGKPVAEVIKKREEEKLPTLSEEEFKAILDLNKKLEV